MSAKKSDPRLYSTPLYSTLFSSALLFSTLLLFDVRVTGGNLSSKFSLSRGARYFETWDTLPSQNHRANVIRVKDIKPWHNRCGTTSRNMRHVASLRLRVHTLTRLRSKIPVGQSAGAVRVSATVLAGV